MKNKNKNIEVRHVVFTLSAKQYRLRFMTFLLRVTYSWLGRRGQVFFSVKIRSFVTFEKATVENEKEISDQAGACPTWANGQTASVQTEGSHFISELQKSVIVSELELSDVLMTYRRGLFGIFIHENVKKRNKNITR
jgi:hypothetical protein